MFKMTDNPAVRAQIEGAPAAPSASTGNPAASETPVASTSRAAAYPAKGLALQNGRYVVVEQPK